MAERIADQMKVWGPPLVSLTLTIIIGWLLIPWARAVNETQAKLIDAVARLSADLQENRAWHVSSEKERTSAEKERATGEKALRSEIMLEVGKMLDSVNAKNEESRNRIVGEIRDTLKTTLETQARLGALETSLNTMSATLLRMRGEVITALEDQGFKRNAPQEKGP